jgi:aspartate-semialdehyde dehydrogenase
MERRKVVVLGAGGLVAQRLQQRLSNHPWFELVAIAGSSRFRNQPLDEVPWVLEETRPSLPSTLVMDLNDPSTPIELVKKGVELAFSALPSEHASTLEPQWSAAGIAVFSNASAYRRVKGIPLVIPEINPDELNNHRSQHLVHTCATNCTLLPLIIPLAALHGTFELESYTMESEQGLSGGGHPYMTEALRNGKVDSEIPGEAEKTDAEFREVLSWNGASNLTCQRVMRNDGHLVRVRAEFKQPVDLASVSTALEAWSQNHRLPSLPSAPHQPLVLVKTIDTEHHLYADGVSFAEHPDPATNLKAGMAIAVGSIVCNGDHHVEFEAYSHNTLRGAAGGVVLLAELACDRGLV